MLKYTKCYFLDSELSLICSVFFRIVNASINNTRERKIVTLNIIILYQGLLELLQSFSSVVVEGNYDLLTQW